MPIKVLILDESELMRNLLSELIGGAPDLKVVGAAANPASALEMIKRWTPDVLTLDVEISRLDGLEFLRRLMRMQPLPVVMVSGLTERGSAATLQALELGAVDCIAKPPAGNRVQLQQYAEELRDKIRAALGARLSAPRLTAAPNSSANQPVRGALPAAVLNRNVVVIGASTGGTEAIKQVLCGLPAEMPPIVIVQHMPVAFTPSFAQRLDTQSPFKVVHAQGGERLQSGHAYLAPGDSHLLLKRQGTGVVTVLSKAEPVNRHRPSVDVLFSSAAKELGADALGVILTGMGRDGAAGMLELHRAGAWNIGQDQASCVVYGMPRAAAEIGALDAMAPLTNIAECLLERLRKSA
ncbi:MAG: chemotaxis response regulator protein-glutamate methylesterase [Rhodocyclaceae bacterium]|nr:chemotaxis response regulator protein-glutamate methylesterase [Rhodocyclaceae bacterium]